MTTELWAGEGTEDVIEKCLEVSSPAELLSLLEKRAADVGARYVTYLGAALPSVPRNPQRLPFHLSNYPKEWVLRYFRERYLDTDPVVISAIARRLPFAWDDGPGSRSRLLPKQRKMMSEASEFGIRFGYTAPVRGPNGELALLTLAWDDAEVFRKAIAAQRDRLLLTAIFAHEAVARLLPKTAPISANTLTNAEKECLLWAARGKSSWETAQILGRSESTINFHLKNASEKLQAANKCHAVVKAVLDNIITP